MTDQEKAYIRVRQDGDLPALAKVLTDVHRLSGYPVEGVDDPVSWLTSDTLIGAWVAVAEGQVVGHVSLSQPRDTDDAARMFAERSGESPHAIAVLGRLFVATSGRGLGLGRRLTQIATVDARNRRRRAVLDVMLKDHAATSLYKALGWSSIGTFDHTYGNTKEPAEAYISPKS